MKDEGKSSSESCVGSLATFSTEGITQKPLQELFFHKNVENPKIANFGYILPPTSGWPRGLQPTKLPINRTSGCYV